MDIIVLRLNFYRQNKYWIATIVLKFVLRVTISFGQKKILCIYCAKGAKAVEDWSKIWEDHNNTLKRE